MYDPNELVYEAPIVCLKCHRENGRLVTKDFAWEGNEGHCIHGVKLRWQCDWCNEYERTHPK